MQAREQPLTKRTGKYFLDEFVSVVTRSQTISVSDVELFTVVFGFDRFAVKPDAKFLFQVAERPHVVIAGEVVYRNTGIREGGDGCQQAHVSSWYYGLVLEPEIKHIAHEIQLPGVRTNLLEPAHDAPFTFQAAGPVGNAEVKIGREINVLTGGHHWRYFRASSIGLSSRSRNSKRIVSAVESSKRSRASRMSLL